jgi:hypothetical protein
LTILNILLFSDDQVILPDSEHELQIALYTLHNTTEQFGMNIFPLKSKIMAFKGQVPIQSKIATDNITVKQVNTSHIWDVELHPKRKRM